jgi:hypothetical protein
VNRQLHLAFSTQHALSITPKRFGKKHPKENSGGYILMTR